MNATMRFLVWGTIPIGSLIGAGLSEVVGVHTTIWIWRDPRPVRVPAGVLLAGPFDPDDPDRAPPAAVASRGARVQHRDPDAALAGDLDRPLVARVDVAHDAHRRGRS